MAVPCAVPVIAHMRVNGAVAVLTGVTGELGSAAAAGVIEPETHLLTVVERGRPSSNGPSCATPAPAPPSESGGRCKAGAGLCTAAPASPTLRAAARTASYVAGVLRHDGGGASVILSDAKGRQMWEEGFHRTNPFGSNLCKIYREHIS
jgi:hypothetical protein